MAATRIDLGQRLQWRTPWHGPTRRRRRRLARRLCLNALNSRVISEQAKGVLAEHGEMAMDDAFRRLRGYARDTNALLARVARDVVDRRVDPNLVLAERPVAGSAAQPDASWVGTLTARQASGHAR